MLIHLIGVSTIKQQVFATPDVCVEPNWLDGGGNLTVSALVLQGSDSMIDFCV